MNVHSVSMPVSSVNSSSRSIKPSNWGVTTLRMFSVVPSWGFPACRLYGRSAAATDSGESIMATAAPTFSKVRLRISSSQLNCNSRDDLKAS